MLCLEEMRGGNTAAFAPGSDDVDDRDEHGVTGDEGDENVVGVKGRDDSELCDDGEDAAVGVEGIDGSEGLRLKSVSHSKPGLRIVAVICCRT